MTTYLVSFLLSFAAALALTPVMIGIARRMGAVDTAGQSHRKVHAEDIPRLGGAAIVLAFFAPIAGLAVIRSDVGDALLGDQRLAVGLLAGGLLIALLGLYDDVKGASPRLKIAVQLAAGLLVVALGVRIEGVDLPLLDPLQLGWLAVPVTLLWIVGVTNAVNLIDGLDGLAAGIALVAIVPMAVLAVARGNLVLALVCCALAGAVLGFLVFNFHPARIFMGDTGSMFLGFTLAVVTMAASAKGRVAVALLTPVLVLGMPILDTFLAIARRVWFGQSLFAGDRQHIHHRLMNAGYSHRGTVLTMYAFAAVFALIGMATHFHRDRDATLLFLLSVVVAGVLLRKIGVLALPGGELSVAHAIRERNRLVRDLSDRLDERRAHTAALDALVHGVGELAFAAGAAGARLEVRLPGEPVRAWSWDDVPATEPAIRHAFALVDLHGEHHGTLVVAWRDDGSFHEASLPRLESGVRRLAERLGDAAPVAAQVRAS